MTGESDYHRRVEYFRKRHAENRDAANAQHRDYRKRNRETIKVARGLGIGIAEARHIISREASAQS